MSDSGFPSGARTTPVPDLFFSRYLPDRLTPAATKLFLNLLWRIHRRRAGAPPAVRLADLMADPTARRGLAVLSEDRASGAEDDEAMLQTAFAEALDELEREGLVIAAETDGEDGPVRWLFVNGHEGRAAYLEWEGGGLVLPWLPAPDAAVPESPSRPTIFELYEDNIGVLTPLLVEELREADEAYPPEWITDAFVSAVSHNARSWAYVRAILERWSREGREGEKGRRRRKADRERDVEGPYASYIKH